MTTTSAVIDAAVVSGTSALLVPSDTTEVIFVDIPVVIPETEASVEASVASVSPFPLRRRIRISQGDLLQIWPRDHLRLRLLPRLLTSPR